ncbi:MAG: aminopeptidase P family protein [Syntrophaceae bacterium]|nr:aminopeptidase P family protein [Syntrophaceae bacterium]
MDQQQNNVFARRASLISRKFSDYNIDSLFFFNTSNIFYLSGFSGSDGVLLLTPAKTILLVDGRYTTQASLQTKSVQVIEYKDKMSGIIQAIGDFRLKKIGFESDQLTVDIYNKISSGLHNKSFVPLSDELKLIRARKDKTEISLMKKAASIASSAICEALSEIRPGITEKDLAVQLEYSARKLGADQVSFDPIVASGKNSALPHAKPTTKKIKKGDFIVIDFGVKYKGYCSDETCTVAFGELTKKQKHAYQAVKIAQEEALVCIKSNVAANAVDRRARSAFHEKYRNYFVHATGHGVGLEVHEAPRLASNSQDVLETNMVVTVEPGLYFPGQWGIRIEDTVLVKENCCEKLTKMDKELIVI